MPIMNLKNFNKCVYENSENIGKTLTMEVHGKLKEGKIRTGKVMDWFEGRKMIEVIVKERHGRDIAWWWPLNRLTIADYNWVMGVA